MRLNCRSTPDRCFSARFEAANRAFLSRRAGLLGAILLAATVALASCGQPAPDFSLARVQTAKTLRIALDASFPPMEILAPDGQPRGIDPDLGRAIAHRLGVHAVFENMGSDGLKDAVLTGQVDAVVSSFSPVREWSRELGYSQPYYDAGPVSVTSLLRSDDGPVAVESGSDAERAAQARWPKRLKTFDTAQQALQALAAGRAGAAVVDAPDLLLFPGRASLRSDGAPLFSVPYVVVVKKSNAALLQAIDRAITDLRSTGELTRIAMPVASSQ